MLDEKNIYTNDFFIESYFCDWTDHLSMWGLSRLLQTVAEEHTTLTHISYFDLIKDQKAWVLSRMYYQVESMPAYGSTVRISTWSRGVDGLFDARDFLVCDMEGRRLASATAYWVVIDFNTRHVVRLNDIMDGYMHNAVCATDKERLTKLRLQPMDESHRIEHFNVKPSMLDHTGHVNNCEYIRWVDDNLPEGKQIKTIEVAYVAETRPGEMVDILRCQPDADTAHYHIYVEGSQPGESNRRLSFSALVTLR
jgi:acyl-ACP thioesterase